MNSEATDQVLGILEELIRDGMTIIIVTHDQRVAAKAKKILSIKDGEVVLKHADRSKSENN